MGGSPSSQLRRKLAVFYTASVPAFELREIANGRWGLVWIIDRSLPDVDDRVRSLGRIGAIADVTGLDVDEAADAVGRFQPAGVVSFNETSLAPTGAIAARLGLPGNSPETVRRLHNKVAQRDALAAHGLCTPRYRAVRVDRTTATVNGALTGLTFPVVIKPQEGSGSRETHRARDVPELHDAISSIARASTSGPVELIVEEYLPDHWQREDRPYADYVSVESVTCQGKTSHVAVVAKTALAEPFIETGDFVPPTLPSTVVDEILDTAGRAVRAMGVTSGVSHTEIKWTPHGPRVIEINGRTAGGEIPQMLSLAGGPSLLEIASLTALDECVLPDAAPPRYSRVGFAFVAAPPVSASRLVRMDNLDQVSRLPGVAAVTAVRRPGDPVNWRDGYEARLFSVYGAADDHDQMWRVRDEIARLVRLEFE